MAQIYLLNAAKCQGHSFHHFLVIKGKPTGGKFTPEIRDNLNIDITHIVLKFEFIIKKPIVENHTFFAVVTFSKINSFAYIHSMVVQHL